METALGPMSGFDPNGDLKDGDAVRLSIRPEDMHLAGDAASADGNVVTGRVVVATFQGSAVEAELACGDETIQCHFGRDADLPQGSEIRLEFDPKASIVLRDEPLEDEGSVAGGDH